jgi:hypothetical protein
VLAGLQYLLVVTNEVIVLIHPCGEDIDLYLIKFWWVQLYRAWVFNDLYAKIVNA